MVDPNRYYFEKAFNELNEIIYVNDATQIIWCNQKTVDFLGYSFPDEIIGKKSADFVTPNSLTAYRERVKRIIDTEEDTHGVLNVIKRDGSIATVSVRSSALRTSDGTFYVTVARPVDKEVLDSLPSDLMGLIKHEINTPISVIWGYAEMIKDAYGESLPSEIEFFLGKILQNVERLAAISDSIIKLRTMYKEME